LVDEFEYVLGEDGGALGLAGSGETSTKHGKGGFGFGSGFDEPGIKRNKKGWSGGFGGDEETKDSRTAFNEPEPDGGFGLRLKLAPDGESPEPTKQKSGLKNAQNQQIAPFGKAQREQED